MRGVVFAMVAVAGLVLARPAAADELLIIANPSVKVSRPLGINFLAAIYLLRITTWPDGTHIVPVNREAKSPVREIFTSRVLRQNRATLQAYWNEMHYRGKLPPVVQESEQAMLAFIRKVPGAVGYIDASRVPAGVRVLGKIEVRGDGG